MAHYEPPHQDLRCLQIQLFSSLVLKELIVGEGHILYHSEHNEMFCILSVGKGMSGRILCAVWYDGC